MLWRFFGKKWCAEIEGETVWLTDAVSATTVSLALNAFGDWFDIESSQRLRHLRIPYYLRERILAKLRRLQRDHQRELARDIALANKALPPEKQL